MCMKNAHGSKTQEEFGAVCGCKCGKEGEDRERRENTRKKRTRKEEVNCDALSIRDTSHQSSEENVETLLSQPLKPQSNRNDAASIQPGHVEGIKLDKTSTNPDDPRTNVDGSCLLLFSCWPFDCWTFCQRKPNKGNVRTCTRDFSKKKKRKRVQLFVVCKTGRTQQRALPIPQI